MSKKSITGFSLVEILAALAILLLLTVGGITAFKSYYQKEQLDKNTAKIEAMFEQARSLTLSSRDDLAYGIHIASQSVTLFSGASYNASATTNQVLTLPSSVTASVSLVAGGSDIIFNRLSGEASNYGTTTVTLVAKPTMKKSIVVHKTGLIDRY